jgi:hypothetical protein
MHLLKILLQNKNSGLGGELHSPSLRVGKIIKLNFHQFILQKIKTKPI